MPTSRTSCPCVKHRFKCGGMSKPFRWSLAKREQLGSWATAAGRPRLDAEFLTDLRTATARILAMSTGANLAFIGRTPENFFDYLSGVFDGVDDVPRLHLVQYSLRWAGAGGVKSIPRDKLDALFAYFTAEGIAPHQIATSDRPLALVDFIAYGGTMETLVRLLYLQATREGTDWNAVQRRLKIIGLTTRGKNSPNAWRWQQNQDWLDLAPDMVIKNVSVPWWFIMPLANDAPKVTHAFHPGRWGEGEGRKYAPSEDQLKALRQALALYDLGQTRDERRVLVSKIARTHQIRSRATRQLVSALSS